MSILTKLHVEFPVIFTGFSLSFKVDSWDVKAGGLAIKCCRQFEAFSFSLYPFALESRWLRPQSSRFFSWLPALNQNSVFNFLIL